MGWMIYFPYGFFFSAPNINENETKELSKKMNRKLNALLNTSICLYKILFTLELSDRNWSNLFIPKWELQRFNLASIDSVLKSIEQCMVGGCLVTVTKVASPMNSNCTRKLSITFVRFSHICALKTIYALDGLKSI